MDGLNHILKQFEVVKGEVKYKKLDSGLINMTYLIQAKDLDKSFILQKINTQVFPNYSQLMNNVTKVSNHINSKLKELESVNYINSNVYTTSTGSNSECQIHLTHTHHTLSNKFESPISPFPLGTGTPYYKDNTNSIWRLSDFIDNNQPDFDNKSNIANETGKILGTFHLLTQDLPVKDIHETIPDFHNIDLRWKKLLEVVRQNNSRYIETKKLFQRISNYENLIDRYNEIIKTNKLPLKIVHNDPKLSNILFKDNKAISLIDPDTIMPGYLPVDFGDAVRSLCNTSGENETDMNKIDFDFCAFKSFSKSYLEIMKNKLSDSEITGLTIFPAIITLEQLIRFYTDYLEGNVYYQVDYQNQNLVRSKVQLKLLEKMYDKSSEISDYLYSI